MQYTIKVRDTGDGQVAIECSPPFKTVVGKAAKYPADMTGADTYLLRMIKAIKEMQEEIKELLKKEKDDDLFDVEKAKSLHLPGRDF